nr:Tubby- protein 1 [Polyrhizophydium stewartii]
MLSLTATGVPTHPLRTSRLTLSNSPVFCHGTTKVSKITDEHRSQVKTLKKELKAWEHKFVDDNGRKPDKQDIAGVPEMAKKYKYYAKLKAAVDKADTTFDEETSPTVVTGDAIQPVTSNQANIPELASPTAQTPGGNVINVSKLPSIVTSNFFLRLQRDGVLRCRLTRRKNLLDKANPTYLLFNEVENKFLLSARKKLISKSVSFIISDSQEDISKDSPHYLAKLNMQESGFSTDIMADLKSKSTNKLLFLKNKTPRWNEATQSHCLNFGGRVTQPSIKNMQLITDEDENYIVLQFGRCGPDLFTLDVRWPMTPVEAFAIALSTFEAYDTYNTGIADLWKYTPNSGQWTWMSGVANISDPGVTESRGVASARNRPPARSFHSMWASSDGSVFIFGGHFFGTEASANAPDYRDGASCWFDDTGKSVYIFGGFSNDGGQCLSRQSFHKAF